MTKKIFEAFVLVWGVFGMLSAGAFLICSAEYIASGNMDYLQRFAVVDGIALLVLLAATAAARGVARCFGGEK